MGDRYDFTALGEAQDREFELPAFPLTLEEETLVEALPAVEGLAPVDFKVRASLRCEGDSRCAPHTSLYFVTIDGNHQALCASCLRSLLKR